MVDRAHDFTRREPARSGHSGSQVVRRNGCCPLCGGSSVVVDRFEFAPKPPLSTGLTLHFCSRCNFLYAGHLSERAYRSYYETVRNDGDHVILSDDPDSYDRLQGAHIAAALLLDFAGSVLDIGCGQGRLLHHLAARYPSASLAGYDVANYLPRGSSIRFLDSIDGLHRRFDVVVLSHIVEHLVEFDLLARVSDLLEARGLVYVEVPDPFQYAHWPRREFMYYFDRLHVNHFGPRAIGRLLDRFGLQVIEQGSHRFRYRDGHYPAAYFIAGHSNDGNAAIDPSSVGDEPGLDAVYRDYRSSEAERARGWRERHAVDRETGILVYGAGDNFHRSLWSDGPLHGQRILAVMDRRAHELVNASEHRYVLPEVALAQYPSAAVVITVSQGSEDVAAALRASSPDRQILFA